MPYFFCDLVEVRRIVRLSRPNQFYCEVVHITFEIKVKNDKKFTSDSRTEVILRFTENIFTPMDENILQKNANIFHLLL